MNYGNVLHNFFILQDPDIDCQPTTPKWLQDACGILLTHLILQPKGVDNIIQGILGIGSDAIETEGSHTKRYAIIAAVISNPRSSGGKYEELEKYFERVCPQILDILSKFKVC